MKGKRIIIAHFDRMQAAALAAALVEEDYDVVTAEDVAQAVASLRREDALVQRADQAPYRAQEAGRNQSIISTDPPPTEERCCA